MIWEIDESTRTIEGLDEQGRPRPDYAAALGLVPAPFGRRVLATTIEVAVYVVLLLPMLLVALPALVSMALDPGSVRLDGANTTLIVICAAASTVLTTAFVIVQLALHGRRGVTLGKAITGLRSVDVRTLERPGFWRGAVVRALVLWASFLVPVVGPVFVIAISPFLDPERRGRGWPDMAGATWFVDVHQGLNPYDAKRMRIARKTVATDLQDVRSELPSLATASGEGGSTAYIPVVRSSGGVLGAPRNDAGGMDAAAPAGSPPIRPVSPVDPVSPGGPVSPVGLPASAGPMAPVRPASGGSSGWAPPQLLPESDADGSAAVPRETGVEVVLDTGQVIAVLGGGILIGRDPAPAAGEVGLTPVGIDDPSKSVSKTHLAILRSGADVVVVDRGSTNGTAIVQDGGERVLVAGDPAALRTGDTIRLGDRHARIRID